MSVSNEELRQMCGDMHEAWKLGFERGRRENTCHACAALAGMAASGRIQDPVLAGQAALTQLRTQERDDVLAEVARLNAMFGGG